MCYTNPISTSEAASQHQPHSTISSLSERTCPSSIPISSLYKSSDQVNHYDFGEDSYYNDDTFETRCYLNASNENCYFDVDIFEYSVYFNDGYAEDCYLTDDYKEVCYLNDGQGVIKNPEAI